MTRGVSRSLVAWTLTLVLAVMGSQIGHALAYRLLTPDEHDRVQLLSETGHGYLGYGRLLLAVGIGILVAVLLAEAHSTRRRAAAQAPAWRFALVAVVVLVAQEHLERYAHEGAFPWTVSLETTFLVALALQLPFALTAYVVARLLLSAARAIGLRLTDMPPHARPATHNAWACTQTHARRLTALALGYGERGPPATDNPAPAPQVPRAWKRGAIATRRNPVARRTALTALAATLVALFAAPAALAHANLISTNPARNAVVAVSPERVTLTFDEPVESEFASIRVLDEQGRQVDDGQTALPEPTVAVVGIDSTLADGTYTVAWRFVSGDDDPIHGAFVFHVGKPGASAGGVLDEVAHEGTGSRAVSSTGTIVRFLGFALILLAAGGAAALALWAAGDDLIETRRRLWLALACISIALMPVTLAAIGLQAASAAGLGLEATVRWALVDAVVDTRFGSVALIRVALAALLAAVALLARHRVGAGTPERPLAIAGCLLGVLLAASPALSGHAQVQGRVAMLVDAIHVEAAAIWTGGLAFLALLLLWSGTRRWQVARVAVPAFSGVAVVSVAALIIAGAIRAILELSAPDQLWETTYGRLLLLKIALVMPLLALGAFNNRFSVPRLRDGSATEPEQKRFLLSAAAELVVVVVVVFVTAVLVDQMPPEMQQQPNHGMPDNP
jgi:copper transport protein